MILLADAGCKTTDTFRAINKENCIDKMNERLIKGSRPEGEKEQTFSVSVGED